MPHKNIKERKEYMKKYYKKNKEKIIEKNKKWKKTKKGKEGKRRRNYNKYHTNKAYRLMMNCRSRIYTALILCRETEETFRLIGCSVMYFRKYLESKFTLGMNWKNYGWGWHIDHIKPSSNFDILNIKQRRECFHYTNLQPLWKLDNVKKGCK